MKKRLVSLWSLGVTLGLVGVAAGCSRNYPSGSGSGMAGASAAGAADTPGGSTTGDSSHPALPPPPPEVRTNGAVGEVILLARSGVDTGVVMAYVTNWAGPFDLRAAEIVYLRDLGVSPQILAAMLGHDRQIGVLPTVPDDAAADGEAPPPVMAGAAAPSNAAPVAVMVYPANPGAAMTQIGDTTFYDALAPYGTWRDNSEYGAVWQPSVAMTNPGWAPYLDDGSWIYSDYGWYWNSSYAWGWAPFHYGRWFKDPRLGWLWMPDPTWAPSWVTWRTTGSHVGWAPLPPAVQYTPGQGLAYHGRRSGPTAGFGLGAGSFVFVPWRHFRDRSPRAGAVPVDRVAAIFEQAVASTSISDAGRHPANTGLPRTRVEALTRAPITPVTLVETSLVARNHTRGEGFADAARGGENPGETARGEPSAQVFPGSMPENPGAGWAGRSFQGQSQGHEYGPSPLPHGEAFHPSGSRPEGYAATSSHAEPYHPPEPRAPAPTPAPAPVSSGSSHTETGKGR